MDVFLKKGAGRSLKGGGLWVYDNEIDESRLHAAGTMETFSTADADADHPSGTAGGVPESGSLVTLRDFDGFFLGYGVYNSCSRIRIRLLSRREEEPVDDALIRRRVQAAWDYRKQVMASPEDLDACRLIFGEADLLPGLTVDRFGDLLVVESLSLGIDRLKERILRALTDVLAEDHVFIRGIYERSDSKERDLEGMERYKGWILAPKEEQEAQVVITENGIRYLVDIENGQKTGFFLDQKYNRLAVRSVCRNARVLDCFTHTGAFALNAAAGGAASVLAVDASETALAQAAENVRMNQREDVVTLRRADIFELLPALEEQGEKFDVVILDPPAFTKSRASVKKAAAGYREINTRGMRLVKDGGYLATCTCSHFMDEALFAETVYEASRRAHVRLRQVEFRQQAPDHPILWMGDANSYYLKFYIFQVFRF